MIFDKRCFYPASVHGTWRKTKVLTRAAVGRVEREAAARTQQDRRKLGHEWEIVDGIRRERERERERCVLLLSKVVESNRKAAFFRRPIDAVCKFPGIVTQVATLKHAK